MKCPRCAGLCIPDKNDFERWDACMNCGRRWNVVGMAAVMPMPDKVVVSEAVRNQISRRIVTPDAEWTANKWKPTPKAKILAEKFFDSITAQRLAGVSFMTITRLLNQANKTHVQAPFLENYYNKEKARRNGTESEESHTQRAPRHTVR